MERMEAGLKSSIRQEMALKTTPPPPPPVYEEFLAVTTAQNDFSSEDFSVDDLLDLSNDDVFAEEEEAEEPKKAQQEVVLCVSSEQPNDVEEVLGRSNEFGSLPSNQLPVPMDELADLEWLSHFVDDSFTEYSTPNLTGTPVEKPAWLTGNRKHPVTPASEESCFKSPLPAKARSRRNRFGVKAWSLGSSGPSSSSSTSSSSSSSGLSSPWFSGAELLEPDFTSEKPPVPKKYKKRSAESVFSGKFQPQQQQQPQRRCSHCGVQKTPQWRAGPKGAKTLCNACGVRYKSGRLLPEYRPACSPTFSSELHSNHHRKVIEMRRKKEPTDDSSTGLNQPVTTPQAVPSF